MTVSGTKQYNPETDPTLVLGASTQLDPVQTPKPADEPEPAPDAEPAPPAPPAPPTDGQEAPANG